MSDESSTILGRLSEEINRLSKRVAELEQRNQELETENQHLKDLLHRQGASKDAKAPQFKENYSVGKHKGKGKRERQSTGRRAQDEKLGFVSYNVDIYPVDVAKSDCVEQRQQYAWRLISGRAEYICYHIYGLPMSRELPAISGLRNSRSEYGIEIILTVAFLHYWIGISLDHVCEVMTFFTGLNLSKSQANALLNQLSRDWEKEYDTIAELLAQQLVIYVDETGWQVGKQACYTWVFSTTLHVLFRCGVGRGKAEAQAILGEQFSGIGVSDDYAVYKYLFNEHQLCWAHLLRKAIKLMLQHPSEGHYRQFFDDLYELYQQAVRWQKDKRLTVGRGPKVELLKARLRELCSHWQETVNPETMPTHEQTFIRLQHELMGGIDALFVFVANPQVEPTNNRSERNLRREAEVRKGGRTSKTQSGAERRSIIMSVLATLNTRFEQFTLKHLLDELANWTQLGLSRFQAELASMSQANALSSA
ncbi:MAG: transposase [Coleofasciculus sp. Co-bin14]|nr:transposase [Coleofasciculus sp. Co-bin14]